MTLPTWMTNDKVRVKTADLLFAASTALGAMETHRDRLNMTLNVGAYGSAHDHAMRVSGAANRLANITLALSHLEGHSENDDNVCPAGDRCPLHPFWTV